MTFWPLLYWFVGIGQEWYPHDPDQHVDLTRLSVQALIAESEVYDDRRFGSAVAWSYSRDRIVERRELRIESGELKAARLRRAADDKAREAARELRLVV